MSVKYLAKMPEQRHTNEPRDLVSGWMRRPVPNSVLSNKPQHSEDHSAACEQNQPSAPSETRRGITFARPQDDNGDSRNQRQERNRQWKPEHGQRAEHGDEITNEDDADARCAWNVSVGFHVTYTAGQRSQSGRAGQGGVQQARERRPRPCLDRAC
jgi:hypothetical protein